MASLSIGRVLVLLTLIFAVILIFLSLVLPGLTTHLALWTLALLAVLALGVVLG